MMTTVNRSAKHAINYFSEGYYDESQTRWYGKGAAALGLSGRVSHGEIFANVCNGLTPDGTKQIGMNTERAAIDCNFAAPKSVSLTALVGGDERLEVAHRTAVEKTLSYMEEHFAQTRVRIGDDQRIVEKTGNLIAAQFDHIESRELDPHMHTHALVMNLTQRDNGDWYSLANEGIKKNQKHFGMIYQSYLAHEVQKLGYETEARPHGMFEIKGYKTKDLETFSKRRQQIISVVGADASWISRENAWSITRKNKQHVPHDELKAKWREEALALGITIVKPRVERQIVSNSIKIEHLDDAIASGSERNVEFTRIDLEKFVLSLGLNPDIRELQPLIDNHADLKPLGENSFTTLAALQREDDTITCMARGRGNFGAIATNEIVNDSLNQSTLNSGQRQAIRLAATTTDSVVAWQGVAGSGKTFALKQFLAIALASGYCIQGFAPSAQAAKVLSTELGIEALTVARKLVTESPNELPNNQIWVVDEAGLLGANDALLLLRRAEKENARIILVGDTKQLSSVAAGNPFKSLQQAGIKTALMNESLRQRTPELKIAIDLLADGMVEKGFRKLEENGSIIELTPDAVVAQIAEEYMLIPLEKRDLTLVLSGTNDKRREITIAIREKLQAEGTIGTDTKATQLVARNDLTNVQMKYVHSFDIGDVVIPVRDYKRRGLTKGERYSVVAKNGDSITLNSADGKQFEVDANFDKALYKPQLTNIAVGDRLKWTKNDRQLERRNGQEFTVEAIEWDKATIKYEDGKTEVMDLGVAQHLDHALVSTTYSSQGKTADRVLWATATDATASTENFYVAASRAKYDLKIFTDNKGKLLDKALESKSNANPRDLVLRQKILELERSKSAAVSVTTERKSTPMPDIRPIVYVEPPVESEKPATLPLSVPSPGKKNDHPGVKKKPTPAPALIKYNDPTVVNEEIVSTHLHLEVIRNEVSLQTSSPSAELIPAPTNTIEEERRQAFIQELLQLESQDLLPLDHYIRGYFQTDEANTNPQKTLVAKEIMEALESPEVSKRVNIQELLQVRGRILLQVNDLVRDYFQTSESEIDSPNTWKHKIVLEALESPLVLERVSVMKVERDRLAEIERMERMEQNQPRRGRGR